MSFCKQIWRTLKSGKKSGPCLSVRISAIPSASLEKETNFVIAINSIIKILSKYLPHPISELNCHRTLAGVAKSTKSAPKGNKQLAFLRRNLQINNMKVKETAYTWLIRPSNGILFNHLGSSSPQVHRPNRKSTEKSCSFCLQQLLLQSIHYRYVK